MYSVIIEKLSLAIAMFTEGQREETKRLILQMAKKDTRIVACALVGSTAEGTDRWSDLDLTFGVGSDHEVQAVLNDWTARIQREFKAIKLFDLPVPPIIYRVFLFPGNLQVDLSFGPESHFGSRGPRFQLLYGKAVRKEWPALPLPDDLFGIAVHHLVRARICIERGRLWQAEYWISSARDQSLSIACLANGLSPYQGRGFDQLPSGLLEEFHASLVGSVSKESLLEALGVVIACLLKNAKGAEVIASSLKQQLQELNGPL